MAYFYVKNSLGTRTTGGGTTLQTGTFTAMGAANVYASIALAIADGAGSGDYICCSDLHSFNAGTALISWVCPVKSTTQGTSNQPVHIVSVDDISAEVRKSGAKEYNSGAGDFQITGMMTASGMTFEIGDRWNLGGARFHWIDCSLIMLSDVANFNGNDGAFYYLENCTMDMRTDNCDIEVFNAAHFYMYGGKVFDSVGGSVDHFLQVGGGNGGTIIRLHGVDLSQVSGTLFNGIGGNQAIDDYIRLEVRDCQLHSSVQVLEETIHTNDMEVLVTGCATSAWRPLAEYQYRFEKYGGLVEEATNIYRDASAEFPSGRQISLKVTMVAGNASVEWPFEFVVPAQYIELSSTSTDVITMHILSPASLTDADVYLKIRWPDGTNKNVQNFAGRIDRDLDYTGTLLTTNTESWTGFATQQRYQLQADTSGDAGADGVPEVTLCVTDPTAVFYLCPTFELS